jgi:hypothetical protein
MSVNPLVSAATRSGAVDENATAAPSGLIAGSKLSPDACDPAAPTLIRSIDPVWRSRTNTSMNPFVSPTTRLVASDEKATSPSAPTTGSQLPPSPSEPSVATLTRSVVPAWRSRTKTSKVALVSPATRFVAHDENTT